MWGRHWPASSDTASHEGYRGRKSHGYGAGGKEAQLGSIWEVVSTLAQALTDARDQLVSLMSMKQHQPMHGATSTRSGRRLTPVRSYSPSAGSAVRNLHRSHAHNHVAFGSSAEYRQRSAPTPPRPRCRPMPPPPTISPASRIVGGAGQYWCTHPLHRSPARRYDSPGARSSCSTSPPPRGGRAGGRLQLHLSAGDTTRVHLDRTGGSTRVCSGGGSGPTVNICFSSSNGGGGGCKSKPVSRSSSPESRRHCIGTQYAALLKEEACQLRERRLAEERKGRRAKWSRC